MPEPIFRYYGLELTGAAIQEHYEKDTPDMVCVQVPTQYAYVNEIADLFECFNSLEEAATWDDAKRTEFDAFTAQLELQFNKGMTSLYLSGCQPFPAWNLYHGSNYSGGGFSMMEGTSNPSHENVWSIGRVCSPKPLWLWPGPNYSGGFPIKYEYSQRFMVGWPLGCGGCNSAQVES